jgi:outer membrane protein
MRKFSFVILSVLAISCLLGIANAKELRLAYIDSDKILEEFADSKEARQKLQDEEKQFTEKANQMEDVVKTMQEEYTSQSLMLSEDARKERETRLQQKMVELDNFRREIWGQGGKLYTRNLELTRPVVEKVNAAIAKVSQDENYDFVFDAAGGNIVHASPNFEITEKVLELLKKE